MSFQNYTLFHLGIIVLWHKLLNSFTLPIHGSDIGVLGFFQLEYFRKLSCHNTMSHSGI